MSTIDVKDANGTNRTAALVTNTGPQAAAESLSVVPSSDGFPVTGPLTDGQLRATPVPVSGPLTDAALRATPVPVSGTVAVSNLPATQPVSATALPLPAGAATAANQSTANASLASLVTQTDAVEASLTSIDGKLPALATGRVPVDGSGVTQPVSAAALPLPTGAATETTLAAMNGKIPALGQAAMTASQPVVIASDQSVVPVSGPLTDAQMRATPVPVNQSGVSATGAITALNANLASGAATANSAVALALNGATGFAVDLRGTFVATVTIQGTVDGTNWFSISVVPAGGGPNVAAVTAPTAAGVWFGNATGLQQVRATASAYTSGTVTVTLRAMQAAGVVHSFPTGQATQAVSGTVTANLGTGSLAAGTNAIGDVGIQYRANATGAASVAAVMSPATPAVGTIKGSAGRLIGWQLQNGSAGLRSVKVFNATAPTLGTTGAVFEIDIPAGGRSEVQLPGGIGFATAITWSATSAKGLTDNTATGLAANDVSGAFFFA